MLPTDRPAREAVPPTGSRDDLRDVVVGSLGLAMVAGVFLDGWAHLNRPGMETFFTPWHAVLYSAFGLLALSIAATAARAVRVVGSWRMGVPPGYGRGMLGVVVFGLGGLADMAWHELFGVEVGPDALLSPTHLMLFVGAIFMIGAPAVAAAARADRTRAAGVATVLSVAAIGATIAFFLSYLSVFVDAAARIPLTQIPEGAPGHVEAELPASAGLGAYLVTTAAIVVPILGLRRRLSAVPTGAVAVTVSVIALFSAALSNFAHLGAAFGAVVGALGVELALTVTRSRSSWTTVGGLVPLGVWSGQLAGLAVLTGDVGRDRVTTRSD